jgi:hypothetical protein
MKRLPAIRAAGALVCVSLGACDSSTATGPDAVSLFRLPASLEALSEETFFDHPWPSDLRRDANGKVQLTGFYNPRRIPLIEGYLSWSRGKLDGFSPAAGVFLRFSAPIDPATLPSSPATTGSASASVQLIDIDAQSPERGARTLVQTYYRRDEGAYWLPSTLVAVPVFGRPMRPKTRYALVVTRALRSEGGGRVLPSQELSDVLAGRTTPRGYEGAAAALSQAGVALDNIAALSVFTTDDPASEMLQIGDQLDTVIEPPAPVSEAWKAGPSVGAGAVYLGTYGPAPILQAGAAPYARDGGGFVFDANGQVMVQGRETLRFALAVPDRATCPEPPSGYPIVLHAHGTGGDYLSHFEGSASREAIVKTLLDRCLASIGIDQPYHGTRAGAPPENSPTRDTDIALATFNFSNPDAGRTNARAAAVDVLTQLRLVRNRAFVVPSTVAKDGAEVRFDPARVTFFGHSQGALNGPGFLAAAKDVRGGVFSGASALSLITYIEKTKPEPSVAKSVQLLLGVSADPTELNYYHPVLNLAQMIVDPSDPLHYARYIARAPAPGRAPKSIFVTEGVKPDGTGDAFTPPRGTETMALALGVPRIAPGVHPIEAAEWLGVKDLTVGSQGVAGNLAEGRASGALAQFIPPGTTDGHFVVFNVPEARRMAAEFLRALSDDPVGRVPAP